MFDLVENWELMNFFLYLGVLLFVAKIIKEKVPFLNRVIIPTALIAGFIGLTLSDGFLNVINLSEPIYEVYNGDLDSLQLNQEDAILIVTAEEAEKMGAIGLDTDQFQPSDSVVLVPSESETKEWI